MKKKLNNNATDLVAKAVDNMTLEEIDQAFGKAFQEIVNFNRGGALKTYQEKMGLLSERLKKLYALLDPEKIKEAFKEFADFLNDINKIVELMERSAKSSGSQLVFFNYLNSILSTACKTVTNEKSKTIQDFLITIQK